MATGGPATGLVLVSPELVIENISDGACELFGQPRERLQGTALPDHMVSAAQAVDALRAALDGQPTRRMLTLRHPDGGRDVWVELLPTAATPTPPGGQHLVASIQLRTDDGAAPGGGRERGRPEAAEVTLAPQLTTDLSGVITSVNQPMQILLGESSGKLLGTALRDLFNEPARVQAGLQLALTQGEATDFELLMTRSNGTETVVSYRAWPLRDENGDAQQIVVALYELGERGQRERSSTDQMAYDELKMAQSEFISKVSHELRSPLTSVLGYLELLDSEDPGPLNAQQHQMLDAIDRGSRRLLTLVEDLLTLSQIEAGALAAEMRPADFTKIVKDACLAAELDGGRKSLTVHTEIEDGLVVEGDPRQLERAVDNLIANALKFSLVGGQIKVFARRKPDADTVVFTVTDTGIGIPTHEQRWLFTKFFRSSLARRMEIKGTGLGLYIVHEIVQGHHGTVNAMSVPGEGTTIVLELPLRQPAKTIAEVRP